MKILIVTFSTDTHYGAMAAEVPQNCSLNSALNKFTAFFNRYYSHYGELVDTEVIGAGQNEDYNMIFINKIGEK